MFIEEGEFKSTDWSVSTTRYCGPFFFRVLGGGFTGVCSTATQVFVGLFVFLVEGVEGTDGA